MFTDRNFTHVCVVRDSVLCPIRILYVIIISNDCCIVSNNRTRYNLIASDFRNDLRLVHATRMNLSYRYNNAQDWDRIILNLKESKTFLLFDKA